MADLCVCGHEERLHSARHEPCCCAERCYCERYTRSPLSAFRGPSVRFTREEAAGWLRALAIVSGSARGHLANMPGRTLAARDRRTLDMWAWTCARFARAARSRGDVRCARACYLATRILRAVRP